MPEPNDQPVTPKPDELKMTPAEQLELERLRAQRVADEKTIEELKARDRDNSVKTTIAKSIASTGIKSHHSDSELFTVLSKQEGVTINVSGDGRELIVEKDGKKIEFQQLVEEYAVAHRNEFDQRTMRHLIDKGSDAIKSRADMTPEEKRAYIQKFGSLAYEKLGLYRVPTLDADKLTAEDWRHLNYEQKSKVVAEHGSEIVSKILKRTGEKK
jgi:hypothetical protein